MKQLLITALALHTVNAQSSDTAVLEAVQGRISELESRLTKEQEAKAKAEKNLNDYKTKQISAMIEQSSGTAVKAFTEDEKKVYENIGVNSGIEALSVVLAQVAKSKPANIFGAIHKEGTTDVKAGWTFDQWQKEDPKGLEAIAKDNPEAFQKLFNEKYKA